MIGPSQLATWLCYKFRTEYTIQRLYLKFNQKLTLGFSYGIGAPPDNFKVNFKLCYKFRTENTIQQMLFMLFKNK